MKSDCLYKSLIVNRKSPPLTSDLRAEGKSRRLVLPKQSDGGSEAKADALVLVLVVLLVLAPLTLPAQLVPQLYSANNFFAPTPGGQPFTNSITIQPWPPTAAATISGLTFIVGAPQTLAPSNGTNIFYLAPNYYRISWAGLPYAATFAVLPGAADQTNIAQEVQSGAAVFWGTNNFGYQVVVDANDTTPGTLSAKIAAGAGGYMTTNNAGGNEVLVFNFPTNLSTLLSQVGFTNGGMVFTMNGQGYAIANTNGGLFQVDTNEALLLTNRFGGRLSFTTNAFGLSGLASAAASLLLSNGSWTVNANEWVPNLTVASNITIGSASLASGASAIVFTNGTQPNINCVLAQLSATVWTNAVYGFSVVSNGQWNYLNASGQTMWALPSSSSLSLLRGAVSSPAGAGEGGAERRVRAIGEKQIPRRPLN